MVRVNKQNELDVSVYWNDVGIRHLHMKTDDKII